MKTPAIAGPAGLLLCILWLAAFQAVGQSTAHPGKAGQVAGQYKEQTPDRGGPFTRQTFHDAEKKIVKEVYQVKDTVRNVPHGRYVSYFLNGNPESRGQFTNNETSGVWEFYFETGKLKMRGILFKSENYGMWEYFFENGQKSMEGIINGRHREGEWKIYYETGRLKETGNYEKNQRSGHWKTFFEDGTLKGEIDYNNNQGRYVEYYHSGKVRAEGPRSGAKHVGFWRQYDENGILQSEGDYTDGMKSGTWTSYYPSGKIMSKGLMESDLPSGRWESWAENGTLLDAGSFEHGRKTGTWTTYTPGGKVKTEVVHEGDHAAFNEYYESGKLKTKGILVNDHREGTWEFYFEGGQREGTCAYKSGKGLYYGYFESGALQTKGPMDDDLKTGTWEIYETDGKLSGYYRPFYDNKQLASEIAGMAMKSQATQSGTHTQPHGHTQKKQAGRRHSGYFTPRYNEVHGVIFGTNPLWLAAGQLPLGIEFYLQERLGHEFEFIGIRDPFFTADHEVPPGKEYERGYSIAIKQKFYNPLNVGMWYFGHEIRFTNVGHFVNDYVTTSIQPPHQFTFNATEQRVEWGILVGYRIMRKNSASGLTIDAFMSTDFGYRGFDVEDANAGRFADVPQDSFSTTFHFGVNVGNVFSFR